MSTQKTYYLVAGEASGDLHGSYLMRAILREDPNARFRFWGGDKMQEVGGELVVHYKERALMGFAQVIGHLGKLLVFIRRCKEDIAATRPDWLIFIDNSGFNLRIAKWAKAAGFTTHYYISPQVWASRPGRVKTIKAVVDQMYVVLPFVEEFYASYHYPVHYVGHPLLDVVEDYRRSTPPSLDFIRLGREVATGTDKIIALLPGSRSQEIKTMLPIMLSAAAMHSEFHYVIAQAPAQDKGIYQGIIEQQGELPSLLSIVDNGTYPLLGQSYAAMVTSGTATLESALFNVPEIVCYKGDWFSYQIAKRLIQTKYISLVNLVLDRLAVPELIQNELTVQALVTELKNITNGEPRNQQLADFRELKEKLGGSGAAERAAKLIVSQ